MTKRKARVKKKLARKEGTRASRTRINGRYYVEVFKGGRRISRRRWRPSKNITVAQAREELQAAAKTAYADVLPDALREYKYIVEPKPSKEGVESDSVNSGYVRLVTSKQLTEEQALRTMLRNMDSRSKAIFENMLRSSKVNAGFDENLITYNEGITTGTEEIVEWSLSLVGRDDATGETQL